MNTTIRRRQGAPLIVALMLILAVLAGCGQEAAGSPATPRVPAAGKPATVLRVGYQKGGSLPILKGQGTLEKRLNALGVTVQWTEFAAGPPLLEALNTGSIDLGSTGQTPPIFAQAAGTPLVYIAAIAATPGGQALIVPKDSPIKAVSELKGKKVAFAKGSSAHFFTINVLQEAGLQYSDIKPVFLTPPDARAAFDGGSVDAWVIWDPYLTIARKATEARVLHDGTSLTPTHSYYLAARSFVDQHPDVLDVALEEIQAVEKWSGENPQEVAKILAPVIGVDASILEEVSRRQKFGIEPVSDALVIEQQSIADTFFKLGLIPKQINIREAVWSWEGNE
ncbi:MAG TPA: sulfonate ABC transporter substrate-binding protein [Herpetosiphonaceae bacterium]|nr:sulfonate ABC transporter substrate-binding protein [Herpetosiphonaceae bacterium]